MKPPPFGYAAPHALEEALALLAAHGVDGKALAGGQSLLPIVNMRLARPAVLVDVNRVEGLDAIAVDDGSIRIGATARQLAVERALGSRVPLLGQALRMVGHVATRARGTVGGSLAHADPAAELPAVLVALDGEVVARSVRGERAIAARDLFLGTFTTALEVDELICEVRLPVRPGARHGFVEFARRHGDFALVGAAAELVLDPAGRIERVALALLGVAEVPLRLPALEAELAGRPASDPELGRELAAAVSAAVDPAGDVHVSSAYRKRVAGVAAARAVARALAEEGERDGS